MIDNIVGLASLPIGVLLFLNEYGITDIKSVFGIDILMIAAFTLLIVQAANIIVSHVGEHNIIASYAAHLVLAFPSFVFFASKFISVSESLTGTLPIVFASFILVEGIYSFFF